MSGHTDGVWVRRSYFHFVLILFANIASAQVVYVDDDAPLGGDGASWESAYRYLQDAVADAKDGTTIHVGQGVYFPDEDEAGNVTAGDREASFGLRGGVTLMGGFAGLDGSDPDARDPQLYPTRLSGDLLENDDLGSFPSFASFDENSLHVITTIGQWGMIVLDGLIISGGNADIFVDTYHSISGGGVRSYLNATYLNCVFEYNQANGGAIYQHDDTAMTVDGCRFYYNAGYYGGALRIQSAASADIRNSQFLNNNNGQTSGGFGGAIFAYGTHVDIVACDFYLNRARHGGALAIEFSDLAAAGCRFEDNSALRHGIHSPSRGGAIRFFDSTSVISNCTWVDNSADVGSGIYALGSSVAISNSIVRLPDHLTDPPIDVSESTVNVSHSCVDGGYPGVGNIAVDPMLDDELRLMPGSPCIDSAANEDVSDQLEFDVDGDPRIMGCRVDMGMDESYFSGPDCNENGVNDGCDLLDEGVYDCNQTGLPDSCEGFDDCNNNGVPDLCDPDCNGNLIPDDCDVDEGTSLDCNGNVVPDECEIDCNANSVPDDCDVQDGFSLDCNGTGIPDECELENDCNNNGIPNDCEVLADCNGDGIPDECDSQFGLDCNQNGISDECDIQSTLVYVDADAPNGIRDGESWGSAYATLDAALSYANCSNLETFEIRIAAGNYGQADPNHAFFIDADVNLLGGFAGYGTSDPDERDLDLYKSIILSHLYIEQYHRVELDGLVVLDGAGHRDLFEDGIELFATDCVFSGRGPALRVIGAGYISAERCRFENLEGEHSWDGRSISVLSSRAVIRDCVFKDNTGSSVSAHIGPSAGNTSISVSRSWFENNSHTCVSGSGYYQGGSGLVSVFDSMFLNNSGDAVSFGELGAMNVVGCTIVGNGGGIGCGQFTSVGVGRNIIWNNGDPESEDIEGEQISINGPQDESASVSSNIIQGLNIYAEGNMDDDPLFAEDGYRLSAQSPAIDQMAEGISSYRDLDGNPRSMDGNGDGIHQVDIGAFEYYFDCNQNTVPDFCEVLINEAGCENQFVAGSDCNKNLVPDECEVPPLQSGEDCNLNGLPDACEGAEDVRVFVAGKSTDNVLGISAWNGSVGREVISPGAHGVDYANGIVAGDFDTLFVSSVATHKVLKISSSTGELLGETATAELSAPAGLLVRQPSTLLVSSYSTDAVLQFDVDTLEFLGSLVVPGEGGLDGPDGLAWAANGNLLVSSQNTDQVLEFHRDSGAFVSVAAEGSGLDSPAGVVAYPQGGILVASFASDQVLHYSDESEFLGEFVGTGSYGLDGPLGLAWGADSNLLVSSRWSNEILRFRRTDGAFLGAWSVPGSVLLEPTHITVGVYSSDCNNNEWPDECDLATGSPDVNGNDIPDECDPDFDGDAIPDDVDADIDEDGYLNRADLCDYSPIGSTTNFDGGPIGDSNGNCIANLIDWPFASECLQFSGPGIETANACLQILDTDNDQAITLFDIALMQIGFGTPH